MSPIDTPAEHGATIAHVLTPRRVRAVAAVAWALALGTITLSPRPTPYERIVSFCVFCGDRATADAMLNTILFVPLGLLVGIRRGPGLALLVGVFVSAGVEAAQLLVPGRYSNLGDLVWNGLGSGVGAAFVPVLRQTLSGASRVGSILAVALPLAWLGLAGVALGPSSGGAPWVPNASFDEPHAHSVGHVEGATVDGAPLEGGPTPIRVGSSRGSDGPRELTVRVVLDEAPESLVSLLTVHDGISTPRMAVALHSDALVWWERKRARAMGLDVAHPHLRGLPDLQGQRRAVTLRVRRRGDETCLGIENVDRCGFEVSPARSWTLLRGREHASESFERATDVAWMATLTFLIGLLGGRLRSTAALAVAFVGSVVVVAVVTPLSEPGATGLAGLLLGVSSGVLLRPVAGHFLEGVGQVRPHGGRPPRHTRGRSPRGVVDIREDHP